MEVAWQAYFDRSVQAGCGDSAVSVQVSVNGIAHIQLSVIDIERCLPFWEKFCQGCSKGTVFSKNVGVPSKDVVEVLVRGPEEFFEILFRLDKGCHERCFTHDCHSEFKSSSR